MTSRLVTVLNRAGIHARPASLIAREASGFPCDVFLEKDGDRINAKSIMGVIALASLYRQEITVLADGPREEEAVAAIVKLFESRFETEN